jgi:sterol 14-demethylase
MSHTPPMLSGGLPVLGHVVEFQRDRSGLFKRGFAEHGDVFAINLAGQQTAVVTGAAHNKTVYTQTDRALNISKAYDSLRAAFGETLFIAGKETYTNQRAVLQDIFKREKMVGYIRAMNLEVQRWLDGLDDQGKTDISRDMQNLTQFVAARAFIGDGFRDELPETFWEDYRALGNAIDPVLPTNWPLPKFIRRDRARARILETVRAIIDRRQAHPDRYDDLITHVLSSPQKDGTVMTVEQIANLFMGLLFAGHETTAGQAAWALILLLEHPEHLARVRAEIEEHVGEDCEVDASTLRALSYTYDAIDETTRLRPSADVQFRIADEPVTFADFEVPQGWGVIVNAANSHHLEDVYTDPEVFDPTRKSRGEGKSPWHIVGFGGGLHKCTGMNFAKNEMAVILARLLKQFDVGALTSDVQVVTGLGANHPSTCYVRYTRKMPYRRAV